MLPNADTALFRKLPSVDEVLRLPSLGGPIAREGLPAVTDAAREVLDHLRNEIAAGRSGETELELALAGIADAVQTHLRAALAYSLRAVINATGVILHTNLGRAPLSEPALMHVIETARSFSNLEFDLETGAR